MTLAAVQSKIPCRAPWWAQLLKNVARECRKINLELNGVLEKYHDSLSCVLGNGFFYGTDEEREEISEKVSKIVDLAVEAHGAKKAITELLMPE